MSNDEEVNKMVQDWFTGLTADFYDAVIQKLIIRYHKCLHFMGIIQKNDLMSVVMM
jgi:hypothetical protein